MNEHITKNTPGIQLANEFMRYLRFKVYAYNSRMYLNDVHHMHCHEFSHLCYVIKGNLNLYLDNKHIVLKPGCCTFLPPFTLHDSCTDPDDEDIDIINISFHDRALLDCGYDFFSCNKSFVRFEGKSIPLFYRFEDDRRMQAESLMRAVSEEFNKHKNMSFDEIADLTARFLRLLCEDSPDAPTRKLAYVKSYSYAILRVIDYISQHKSEKLTIDKLCEIAGMSRRLFTNQFLEITGMSCAQFIFHFRLSLAKHFLAHTTLNAGHIARDVGFVTNARLTHVFRENLGSTPGEYRSRFPHGLEEDMDYWKIWSWFRKKDFERLEIV